MASHPSRPPPRASGLQGLNGSKGSIFTNLRYFSCSVRCALLAEEHAVTNRTGTWQLFLDTTCHNTCCWTAVCLPNGAAAVGQLAPNTLLVFARHLRNSASSPRPSCRACHIPYSLNRVCCRTLVACVPAAAAYCRFFETSNTKTLDYEPPCVALKILHLLELLDFLLPPRHLFRQSPARSECTTSAPLHRPFPLLT